MQNHTSFIIFVLTVVGLSINGCTVTPQPIKPQDDIKPGRGLLTGEKGYFEVLPQTERSSPEETHTVVTPQDK